MFLIYFLGFIVIYSTTQGLYENHLTNFGIGLVIFFIFQFVDLEVLVKKSFYLYLVVFILLLLIFVIGHTALGASRWLRIGELSLQPSEFAKISTILLISYILSGYREWTLRLKKITLKIKNRFIQSFILTLPLLVMVLIQPDLGTTISIFLVFVGLLFISSFEKKYFLIALILAGIFSNPLWNSLQDYQKKES